MIVVIDYGMGNLQSVQKALKRIGADSKISSSSSEISGAAKLILPGVGHFKNGMNNLRQSGLDKILCKKVVEEKTPVLGICLGMQLFTKWSEEADMEGFGWIDAKTVKFVFHGNSTNTRIPHMGWNSLSVNKKSSVLEGIADTDSFYFVHSYFVQCEKESDILSTTSYGAEFVSSFQKENITGVQFHPEKSHSAGLRILNNFCKT